MKYSESEDIEFEQVTEDITKDDIPGLQVDFSDVLKTFNNLTTKTLIKPNLKSKRKVIQIITFKDATGDDRLTCLCDDGTVWKEGYVTTSSGQKHCFVKLDLDFIGDNE